MNIALIAEPFLINFNLLEKTKLDKNQNIYKFSVSFTHYDNEEITFSLPKSYQTYLHTNDIERLINVLSTKIDQLKNHNDKEVYLSFEKNCFLNIENDIEIIVDAGEYYTDEDNGLLYLIIFFNINVAYKESGATKIGIQTHVELSNMKKFLMILKGLLLNDN